MSPARKAAPDEPADSPAHEREIYVVTGNPAEPAGDPVVTVGGTPFIIRALTPYQSFALDQVLASIAGAAVNGGGLLRNLTPADKLALVAMILHTPDHEVTAAWVEAHAKPVETLRVLSAWLGRDDVQEYLGEALSLLRQFRPPAPKG